MTALLALLLAFSGALPAREPPGQRPTGLPRAGEDASMERAQEELLLLRRQLEPLVRELDGLRGAGLSNRGLGSYREERVRLLKALVPGHQRFLLLRNEFTKVRLDQTWVSVVGVLSDASRRKAPSPQAASHLLSSQTRRAFSDEARAFEARVQWSIEAEEAFYRRLQEEDAARSHRRRVLLAVGAAAALLALIAWLSL